MKIALLGYGKTGKTIEQLAPASGHSIVAKLTSQSPITTASLAGADVCIDFSHPACALQHIKTVSDLNINLVMGTTGWYQHLPEIKKIIEKSNIGFLYASNFSLGVVLFLQIMEQTARLMAPYQEYDVNGMEIHHNQKVDSPSGTAKSIISCLQKHLKKNNGEISFSSVRVGSVPGTHSVFFDSPSDTITLTHAARNRESFASGAIRAAEWLAGRKGFYTLDDMFLAKNSN